MGENKHSELLSWGELLDVQEAGEASNLMQDTSGDSSCQQEQSSQSPTQQTPDQKEEEGRDQEHQNHADNQAPGQREQEDCNQVQASRPSQQQGENGLRGCAEKVGTLPQQEKELWEKLQDQANLSHKMISELEERVRLERAARQRLEEVSAKDIKLFQSAPNGQHMELQQLVESLKHQLQAEKLRASHLFKDCKELRFAFATAHQSTDLERISQLEKEKEALKKELDDAKRATQRKDVLNEEQRDRLTIQLQEKDSSCLELASKLKDQEEVSKEEVKEVEEVEERRKGEKYQEFLKTKEPSLQMDDTKEDTEEETPNPDQDTSDIIQMAPEMVEEPSKVERISLWRRFKKLITPKSRRQYKQQRRQHQE